MIIMVCRNSVRRFVEQSEDNFRLPTIVDKTLPLIESVRAESSKLPGQKKNYANPYNLQPRNENEWIVYVDAKKVWASQTTRFNGINDSEWVGKVLPLANFVFLWSEPYHNSLELLQKMWLLMTGQPQSETKLETNENKLKDKWNKLIGNEWRQCPKLNLIFLNWFNHII